MLRRGWVHSTDLPDLPMLNGIEQYFAGNMAALGLRAQRSEVLASNIANADTPNFKARDFDFAAALQTAMQGSRNGQAALAVTRTSAGHLDGAHRPANGVDLKYRTPFQASIDGNTVELDTELAQFSDNAIRYQAELTFVSTRIRGLQVAITGQ
jgi:flagellar basal-body rod protein FlgB